MEVEIEIEVKNECYNTDRKRMCAQKNFSFFPGLNKHKKTPEKKKSSDPDLYWYYWIFRPSQGGVPDDLFM